MLRQRPTGVPRNRPGTSQGGFWWWVALGLMVFGVGLGLWGFRELPHEDNDFFDDVYQSFLLLVFDDPSLDEPQNDNGQLDLARWIAPVGLAWAAIVAFLLVFRSESERIRARRRSGHDVVAGLGGYGLQAATALRARREKVVGIDLDDHAARVSARDAGVAAIEGDAQTRGGLVRAAVHKARRLVVTCGDDVTNVEVARQAARLAEDKKRSLDIFVHLDDLTLWRELRVRAAAETHPRTGRIEYFNCFDTGARVLTQRHPPPLGAGGPAPRVLLVGSAGVAPHLLLHLARWWDGTRPSTDDLLPVTMVGPRAVARVAQLAAGNPRLHDLVRLEVADDELDLYEPEARRLVTDGHVDCAYVCGETDAQGLGAAMGLHGAARTAGVPIVLVLDRDDRAVLGQLSGAGPLPGIEVFGLLSHALAPETIRLGTNEILARAAHEHYVRTERAKGIDERTNPSVTTWERLPESLKESNRAFARRIGARLEQLDCWLVPDPLAAADPGVPVSAEEVEALARAEHEDWCDERRRSGWREGPSKDADRRIHHLLVSWSELSEEERDKDRAAVEALPGLVARAGFRMVRRPKSGGGLPSEVQGASVDT